MIQIHPTAIVHPGVQLGRNVRVGAYTVIHDNVRIGDNTFIASHVSIGEEAEHSTNKYELHPRDVSPPIVIGRDVVIREFTTVNRPIKEVTLIADGVYIMAHVNVAHDCRVEEEVVLSNNAILAGWTRVLRGANVGICAATHQYTTIGQYSMIAANATVVKDVLPLAKFIPGKDLGLNVYAIRKWDLPLHGETLAAVADQPAYRHLLKDWANVRDKNRPVYSLPDGPEGSEQGIAPNRGTNTEERPCSCKERLPS
jgi:UDP-N-acetylglucosamine acyltransferase